MTWTVLTAVMLIASLFAVVGEIATSTIDDHRGSSSDFLANYIEIEKTLHTCAVPSDNIFKRPIGQGGQQQSSAFDMFCYYQASKNPLSLFLCQYYQLLVENYYGKYCDDPNRLPMDTATQYTQMLQTPSAPCKTLVVTVMQEVDGVNKPVFSSTDDCETVCHQSLFCTNLAYLLSIMITVKPDIQRRDAYDKSSYNEGGYTKVVFLDTELSISDRQIKSNLHFKPTDSHNYLMYPSNHPRSCTNSIPFSQLLRARRICSDDQDFAKVSKQIISFFEQRQYPQRVLSNALKRIQGIDRASALAPKTDHTPTRRIPLVLSFHPSVTPIVRAIYRNVETLRHDPSTRDHFPDPPITAFRIEKNISKHLVRASQPQAVVPDTPGTFPCNRGRCNTCPVVSYDKNLSIVGPNNNRFNVHQHFTCTSANVVYVLVCKRCNILYVGETKRRLADRVTEHLRSIKQNLPGFPVATHFNPPSTCSIRDLMVSAAISCRGSDHDRLAAENRLIMKLGTLSPHGLNVRLELL
ncbi:hypothetical protein HOLleu_35733 [Holothuria leucospilota]|uniref:GIY-YIG domain-containing protein n=2 Tax=Holothuria leucospilota TaxID=206669 RepID=A0A9Q0YQC2_HOLLE|nr:hypothetical protein HOLleu_35733 [Holothuria leucospilota]